MLHKYLASNGESLLTPYQPIKVCAGNDTQKSRVVEKALEEWFHGDKRIG